MSATAAVGAATPTLPTATSGAFGGLRRRAIAGALDLLFIFAASRVIPLPALAWPGIAALYLFIFWSVGGTPATRLLGLRLVDRNGRAPGPLRALVRVLALLVALAPAAVGFLWIALDLHGQGWHDRIAGTYVVHGRLVPRDAPSSRLRASRVLGVAVLALAAVLVGGAAFALLSPEVPGGPASLLPPMEEVRVNLPFIGATGSAPPASAAYVATLAEIRAADVAQMRGAADPLVQRGRAIAAQLAATGLPISGTAIVAAPDGAAALVVGLDYERLAGGSASAGIGEGYEALLALARGNTLSLAGLGYVTVAVQDAEGRTMFAVSAPSTAIDGLRGGSLDRAAFVRQIAFRGESRMALLGALVDQVRGPVGGPR